MFYDRRNHSLSSESAAKVFRHPNVLSSFKARRHRYPKRYRPALCRLCLRKAMVRSRLFWGTGNRRMYLPGKGVKLTVDDKTLARVEKFVTVNDRLSHLQVRRERPSSIMQVIPTVPVPIGDFFLGRSAATAIGRCSTVYSQNGICPIRPPRWLQRKEFEPTTKPFKAPAERVSALPRPGIVCNNSTQIDRD